MKTIIIVLTGLILCSCSKREDYFLNENQPVKTVVTLLNASSVASSTIDGNLITDTLKLGYYYRFEVKIEDEKDVVTLNYYGAGTMYMDGSLLSETSVEIGTHLFEWIADTVGLNNFSLTFKDGYDSLSTINFDINVFYNVTPSVSWVLVESPLGGLNKKIVVSGTDGDAQYGGEIIGYEYVINGNSTIYSSNEFIYSFPATGEYSIKVRAKDNNNEWGVFFTNDNYLIQ